MSEVVLFAVLGLGAGAVYAILGMGLVVAYRGTGVVNFAQGAIALVGALLYSTFLAMGLRPVPALGLTLALTGIGGAALYLAVLRRGRRSPILAQLVTTLGLLIALRGAAAIIWGSQTRQVEGLLPVEPVTFLDATFGRDRLWLAVVAAAMATVLTLFYRRTRIGIVTLAAVQSEKGTVISGWSPVAVGTLNWALASVLAALGGVLIAPITSINPLVFALLLIPALAAALVGRFSSLVLTASAGLAIGVIQSEVVRYVDQPGARDAIPFLVIGVILVVSGRRLPHRSSLGAGRLPLAPDYAPSTIAKLCAALVVAGAVTLVLSPTLQFAMIVTVTVGILSLSLVVVTGYVGQISLAQMTFAGLGALLTSKVADAWSVPFPASILVGALLVVPAGLLIGLPALRVRGQNLAVVTLGAAVAVQAVIFNNADYTGGIDGTRLPPPELFGVDLDPLDHPDRYVAFTLLVLIIVFVGVWRLRRSGLGHNWLAVRRNERAAAAVGINVEAAKLQAFGLSSFIAALAGGLFGYALGTVTFVRFAPFESILLLAIAYVGAIAAPAGALLAGLIAAGGLMFTALEEGPFSWLDADWVALVTGLNLMFVAIRFPDGLAARPGALAPALLRRADRGDTRSR